MALEPIRPKDLPAATLVTATGTMIPGDNGAAVQRVTPTQIVNAVAPVASLPTALAGVNNTERMTPLTVKQVLDNETAPSVLLAQAWAESATAPNPLDPTSKSSKTWAGDAAASAVIAQTYAGIPFASRAAAQAATVGATVKSIFVMSGKLQLAYVDDVAGTALITADGRKWSPLYGTMIPDHWAENTTPGVTDMTAAAIACSAFAVNNGKKIILPAKTYLVAPGAFTLGTDVILEGANREASTILISTATGEGVLVSGSRSRLQHLKVKGNVTRTADALVAITIGDTLVDDVRFENWWIALEDRSPQGGVVVSNNIFRHTQTNAGIAHYINKSGVNTRLIANTYSVASYVTRPAISLQIDWSGDINMVDCQYVGADVSLLIGRKGVGLGCGLILATNCYFDNANIAGIQFTSDGKFENCVFSNCWFGNNSQANSGRAVWIEPAVGGFANNVMFTDCMYLRMDYGIFAKGAAIENLRIQGGNASQNGVAGVYLEDVSSGYVRGLMSGPQRAPTFGPNGKGAILVGNFGTFAFEQNDLKNNTTAAIDVSGLVSGMLLQQNYGVTSATVPDRGPDAYLGKLRQVPYCTVGGTANALSLTTGTTLNALTSGQRLCFTPTTDNTGTATVNVDGLGAVSMVTVKGGAMPVGYLRAGILTHAHFDGVKFITDRQIETSSNANGTFAKYADGRMECKSQTFSSIDATTAAGSIFRTAALQSWTFPAPFANTSAFVVGSPDSSNTSTHWVNARQISTVAAEFTVFAPASITGRGANIWASGPWY